MKIIYKYLIKKFVGPFILTFAFALVIFLMQFLWVYVDDLVGKGLEIHLILELLLYASAGFVSSAAPLAILLSSLMIFGSLGEHYELVALKSAGIPISKLMIPLSIFALFVGGISFIFSNNIAPKAYVQHKNLLFNFREQKPALAIDEGVFYDGIDNYIIRVGKKHRDNERIEDILIYDHSGYKGNTTITYAKRGSMSVTLDGKYMLFYLYDGYFWDEDIKQGYEGEINSLTRAKFKEQYKRMDISSFAYQNVDNSYYKETTKALSNNQLQVYMDTLKTQLLSISEMAANSFYNNLQHLKIYYNQDSMLYAPLPKNIRDEYTALPYEKRKENYNHAKNATDFLFKSVNYAFEEADYKNKNLWSYEIEWHRKYTQAFACFLLFFIGASLGSIIRKGGIGIPLLITVIFFVFYFSFSIMGEKMAKGSLVPVPFGMWLSSLILIPICVFLTKKATTDSVMFSKDEYEKRFGNILRKLKLRKEV